MPVQGYNCTVLHVPGMLGTYREVSAAVLVAVHVQQLVDVHLHLLGAAILLEHTYVTSLTHVPIERTYFVSCSYY